MAGQEGKEEKIEQLLKLPAPESIAQIASVAEKECPELTPRRERARL